MTPKGQLSVQCGAMIRSDELSEKNYKAIGE
jgi:hypothetical protein